MSLEGQTVYAGEKLSLVGGAVRAEVQGVWRGQHRYASGILNAKTKTIYRSKSAQVYLFIQLCKETYDFDEDGERYYEKVVHGEYSPGSFTWTKADGQASCQNSLLDGATEAHHIWSPSSCLAESITPTRKWPIWSAIKSRMV